MADENHDGPSKSGNILRDHEGNDMVEVYRDAQKQREADLKARTEKLEQEAAEREAQHLAEQKEAEAEKEAALADAEAEAQRMQEEAMKRIEEMKAKYGV